ncbi:MAG: aspartate aminotransferase family protein [Solibacterales bacterium]|nr:aspartate aminotransferase family protein [Bryobacterales bacterium]|tara:strand:- start:24872 stop:26095 length:1224 start_codon:yes stop_codon:yes gene_type:complete
MDVEKTHSNIDTLGLGKQHLIQSYAPNLVIERGEGCHLYAENGKHYLDFMSGIGVNALGHAHPRVVRILKEQINTLIHCSNLYASRYQAPLAEHLARISGLQRVFFTNSGTESVEGAVKITKIYGHNIDPKKYEIVALNGSFGGRTLGAVSVTGQPKHRAPVEPIIPGVKFVDPNDISGLEAAVCEQTAGILFEPILGEGGIVSINREFAARAAALSKQYDTLLVFDEIQSGLGRTGKHFSFQWWNEGSEEQIQPDIVVTAKPLASGLPLGAIIANERASATITPGSHGSTFGGNVLACRVALEFLVLLEDLLPEILEKGAYFSEQLTKLIDKYDFVEGFRGRGLMCGLNLTVPGSSVVTQCQNRGFLINCTAGTVLRFLPPYIIERAHIDALVATLDEIFRQGPPD